MKLHSETARDIFDEKKQNIEQLVRRYNFSPRIFEGFHFEDANIHFLEMPFLMGISSEQHFSASYKPETLWKNGSPTLQLSGLKRFTSYWANCQNRGSLETGLWRSKFIEGGENQNFSNCWREKSKIFQLSLQRTVCLGTTHLFTPFRSETNQVELCFSLWEIKC